MKPLSRDRLLRSFLVGPVVLLVTLGVLLVPVKSRTQMISRQSDHGAYQFTCCIAVLGGQLLAMSLLLVLSLSVTCAQQLSVHRYNVSDGLAQNVVHCIHQDAKGYIWFGTSEGLSRFDGYHFTNYGTSEGLGHFFINAIAEDRQGRIWIGTNGGGVSRLIDDTREALSPHQRGLIATAKQRFITFRIGTSEPSNRVNAMLFDADNDLWCATDDGLYRAAANKDDALKFEVVAAHAPVAFQMAAFADSQDRLWFGVGNDLIEVAHGQIIKYGPADGVGRYVVISIVEDLQGRLLVANVHEVFEFIATTDSMGRGRWKRLPLTLKPDQVLGPIFVDSLGELWVGTIAGLIKYQDGKQTLYTTAQGLSDNRVLSLEEDGDGNLWIGTWGGGVCKLSGEMILSFTKTEGLPNQNVLKVIPAGSGRVYVSFDHGLAELVAGRAVPIERSQSPPFNNVRERILQDSHGDWWIGTEQGLFFFQGPELQLRRGRRFTTAEGISEAPITSVVEDSSGRLWVRSWDYNLYYSDSVRNGSVVFQRIPPGDISTFNTFPPMIRDRSGTVWLGRPLSRLRQGKIATLEPAEGLPEPDSRALFQDSRGWLWVGLRYQGVSMTKDPETQRPHFVNYSTENGLAGNAVWSIAEDDFGRMYFGTSKGLDRLDLTTGRIRHFTSADGLAGDDIHDCVRDGQGNIWVATTTGVSKLNPRAERIVNNPPPIYLSRVQVAGEDLGLPETGATRLPALEFAAARNNLLIEYVGLDFQGERALKYQYKLDGVDSDWSPPAEQRSVNYARLAAGRYKFLVRAVNPEGVATLEPAQFEFRILPAIWQRWWFLSLVALLMCASAYLVYRYRLRRVIELERVRTRIASDLHDDIGANLSLIAMFSEVARRRAPTSDPQLSEWLSSIASTSRELVDSMSDIVWAVNPKKDRVRDLTKRMRRFASDSLSAHNIKPVFHSSGEEHDQKLGADTRREVFLIFKESINNIVRHAKCSQAEIAFQVHDGWAVLEMNDNGRGFNPVEVSDGNGLISMRRRAENLGGRFEVISHEGQGTKVTLRVPVGRRSRRWHAK